MKKILVMAALACLALPGIANADLSGSAYSHVFVNVVPNITVAPMLSTVPLGNIQTGAIGLGIVFRVDANTEQVKFSAGASKLYKGDCPTCTDVSPILLSGGGIAITAEAANPIGGGSTMAGYTSSVMDIQGGFMGQQTDWITFESALPTRRSTDDRPRACAPNLVGSFRPPRETRGHRPHDHRPWPLRHPFA